MIREVQYKLFLDNLPSPLVHGLFDRQPESFPLIKGSGHVKASERPQKNISVAGISAELNGLAKQNAADTQALEPGFDNKPSDACAFFS
jgi:hypothetical protein